VNGSKILTFERELPGATAEHAQNLL